MFQGISFIKENVTVKPDNVKKNLIIHVMTKCLAFKFMFPILKVK